jgi:L-Ala-D/L-Glu epimerase
VKHTLKRLSIPFREPFATSGGVVTARELLLLRLEDADGVVGHGEAAPFEPYDGVSLEQVEAALRGIDPDRVEPGASDGLPAHARAAVEMALLDLRARREARPVGEPGAEAIAVNRTLPAGPPEEVALRAREGVRAGYSCFKLKVGLPDDADRVAAARDAIGPWPALRVDANGAWSPQEAIRMARAFEPYDIELLEQPCPSLAELREVRASVDVAVAADESIASAGDVQQAADSGACDAVNVKLAASGGFHAARAVLRAAADRRVDAFLSSTLDGPWGIAASLQLAASERISRACGLATLELFDARLARAIPPPTAGLQAVPQGPGLGVPLDREALDEVVVQEIG